ncbi:hypothetical protein [Legionella bononiensis]|uniref:hypothetical protein n=1 Tax=Legionella bononiensis TaxID=2793102 RepID=UPI0019316F7F|nr:hypothetical protein [Legionella bononiensis]MBL7480784.1 hypothetical protein [Legionella bononiensis]
MRFIGKPQGSSCNYNFDFSTNRDSERRMPHSEPTLYFDTYGFPKSNLEYLKNILGLKINGDRYSTITSDPAFSIMGKDDVISAIEIILTSEKSFLNLELKPHKKLFNELIDFSKSLGGQLQVNKIDDSTGYETQSELFDALMAKKSQPVKPENRQSSCSIS